MYTTSRVRFTFAMLGFSNGGTPKGPSGTTHGIVIFNIHFRRSWNANKQKIFINIQKSESQEYSIIRAQYICLTRGSKNLANENEASKVGQKTA